MPTSNLRLLTCLSIVALPLAACSTAGSTPNPSEVATPSSTAGGSALVYGTMTCQQMSNESRMEGDNEVVLEHFSCSYAVNDPRLDGGQYESDFTTTFEPADAPAARWEATVTITTAGGAWTGEYRGALVVWSGTSAPHNYGEGTYTGSGGYQGLVYHEVAAGSNAVLTVSGSIEPAE